jgi:hypothetical protein
MRAHDFMMPNVFIAGAQKSGTTTLCAALDRHPQALVSTPKEPAFFSRAANLGNAQIYEECFQAKRDVIPRAIVDGSNAYMVDPLAPSRIRDMLGEDLRFIFCLRDPVARAVSGYWHQAKKGRECRPLSEALSFASSSLDEAIREEQRRLRHAAAHRLIDIAAYTDRYDDPLWNFRYLRNSLYAADLTRFYRIFGAARVKVVLFEELVGDPVATLSLVAAFLNIDPAGFPTNLDLHRNPTRLTRAPVLVDALRRLCGRELLRRIPGYEAVTSALLYRRPPLADLAVKTRLHILLAPDVSQLQAMLNRDLGAIWSQV